MPTWAQAFRKRNFEKGKRQGYAMGMAQGMAEAMTKTLAEGLSKAMEEVLTEHFLHCIKKGRIDGMKQVLSTYVVRRFGEEVAEEFEKLIDTAHSADTVEKLVDPTLWCERDEDLLEKTREVLAEMPPLEDPDVASQKPN